MANKKIPISFNNAEADVEKRVDAMMVPTDKPEPTGAPVPIDIFNDPKTAPQVPAGLQDKLLQTAPAAPAVEAAAPKKISIISHEPDATAAPVVTSAPELPSKKKVKVVEAPVEEADASPAEDLPAEPEVVETPEVETPDPEPITPEPPVVVPSLVKNPSDAIIPKRNYEPTVAPATSTAATAPAAPATRAIVNDVSIPPLKIDDSKTDAAIDDIAEKEGDELFAAQDELQKLSSGVAKTKVKKPRRRVRKLWLFLLLLVLALVALVAIPASRYKVAGLVVKKTLMVQVLDSKSQTPVSKAEVVINGQSMQTDAGGVVKLNVGVGNQTVAVSKQYYTSASTSTFVDFADPQPLAINLVATGRQVPVTVVDMLTDEPISGAEISILNTNAKTDGKGKAIIVLPTKTATVDGKITSSKFTTRDVKVTITDKDVAENTFKLTPAGKVYFLSNEAGTIDVVKANLDGTDRKTVLKGTGKEDANTTVLLSSRDWKFSVLKAQRSGAQAAMYLIDSSTDKLTEFDAGDANFTPIGWSGHSFIYDAVRNSVATSQTGHELIKSYDADRGQLLQLDQSQAEGDGVNYVYQSFYNFNIIDDTLIYNTQWYSSGTAELAKKTNAIRSVLPTGQSKKDLQTFAASGTGYIQAAVVKPQEIAFGAFNFIDNKTKFFEYKNGAATETTGSAQVSFNKLYPVYVASPTGQQIAWSEMRDGKQVVLLADAKGANPKVQTNLAGFKVFGWYSASYLLVSKNNSELYIVAANGSKAPAKLTDYYKPTQNPGGYGNF